MKIVLSRAVPDQSHKESGYGSSHRYGSSISGDRGRSCSRWLSSSSEFPEKEGRRMMIGGSLFFLFVCCLVVAVAIGWAGLLVPDGRFSSALIFLSFITPYVGPAVILIAVSTFKGDLLLGVLAGITLVLAVLTPFRGAVR